MDDKLNALINLLDDPDEGVYQQIKSELIAYGDSVIPALETAWETMSLGADFQYRIEEIIHQIQFQLTRSTLKSWKENGSKDLFEGIFIINKYQYPDINRTEIEKQIARIKQDVWLEINNNLTAYEQVNILNKVLFGIYGLKGNRTNYHAPQNNFISDVLETKKGNPLSISIIYILIANALDIPIVGINLPSHFIVGYKNDPSRVSVFEDLVEGTVPDDEEILFYINPFSRGVLLEKQEITNFLEDLKIEPEEKHFVGCNNSDIIKRTIINLIVAYQKLGYTEKESEVRELLSLFE